MIDTVVDGIDLEEVVELTSRLVEIDTSNPPGNEELAARYLGGYLAEAGILVEYREVEPGRTYLIARLPGRERTGHLVFSGHLDVVPAREPGWEHDPFRATRVDGRLIGRGTVDMKGGLAAMAVAMTALRRSGFVPRADLILAASIGEERGMMGALDMAGCGVLAGVDYLLVGEPTGLDICPAQRGALIFSLTVHGHGAHSSMPEHGVSTISYMARAIVALESHRFPYQHTDLLGAPSINIGTIEGGVAANIVPDRCAVLGNIRLVAGQSWEAVETDVRAILDAVKRESELPVDIQLEARGVSACLTDLDHPLVQAAVEAAAAVSGSSPRIRGFTGGTEAGILCRAYGMPMTIFGPGKLEQAHQVNEYVDIAELIQAAQAYTLIASTLLG